MLLFVHHESNTMFQSNTTKPSFSGIEEDPVMPIAIIGFSGRFPGDAENPTKLWDMIAAGKSALSDIPKDRFNVDAYYHPHHERHGILNVRKAHFMKRDISAFDAPFFTMSIPEAEAMDPQQRMALECTYEALENGKLTLENLVILRNFNLTLFLFRSWTSNGGCQRIQHIVFRGMLH